MQMTDIKNRKKSIARFLQVTTFGDAKNSDIRPWIELACLKGAVVCNEIGDEKQAVRFQKHYLRTFPEGTLQREIQAL